MQFFFSLPQFRSPSKIIMELGPVRIIKHLHVHCKHGVHMNCKYSVYMCVHCTYSIFVNHKFTLVLKCQQKKSSRCNAVMIAAHIGKIE